MAGDARAEFTRRLEEHAWCEHHGLAGREELKQALSRATAIVLPSREDNCPMVILEAMAAGVPVIASRIDGNVGLLGDDYPGYFPPGDAAALARCLERARDDPAWRADLQQAAALRVPLFAPEAERQALMDVLRRHGLP